MIKCWVDIDSRYASRDEKTSLMIEWWVDIDSRYASRNDSYCTVEFVVSCAFQKPSFSPVATLVWLRSLIRTVWPIFGQFFEFSVEVFNGFALNLLCDYEDVSTKINISWTNKCILYYFLEISLYQGIGHYMQVFNSESFVLLHRCLSRVLKLFFGPQVARVCPHKRLSVSFQETLKRLPKSQIGQMVRQLSFHRLVPKQKQPSWVSGQLRCPVWVFLRVVLIYIGLSFFSHLGGASGVGLSLNAYIPSGFRLLAGCTMWYSTYLM